MCEKRFAEGANGSGVSGGSMLTLSHFERSALQDIATDCGVTWPPLQVLPDLIRVESRENTGHGFLSRLHSDSHLPSLGIHSPTGERLYRLGGFGEPFGVALFLQDGRPSLLDCHFLGTDSTNGTDFCSITFSVWARTAAILPRQRVSR